MEDETYISYRQRMLVVVRGNGMENGKFST